jgi:hypothetical protein
MGKSMEFGSKRMEEFHEEKGRGAAAALHLRQRIRAETLLLGS